MLSESGAILVYLAEKAGQLAAPQRHAQVVRWCFAALTTVEPVTSMIVLDDFGKSRVRSQHHPPGAAPTRSLLGGLSFALAPAESA